MGGIVAVGLPLSGVRLRLIVVAKKPNRVDFRIHRARWRDRRHQSHGVADQSCTTAGETWSGQGRVLFRSANVAAEQRTLAAFERASCARLPRPETSAEGFSMYFL